ncbi:MAG TPA: PQQ-binding-like beta-propeller repeat protein [Verrucomicrobiales bacterium]|jgi:outer membrane protein assembly factor BamB|nr:PQQ-binding-like beta-propeller repeat protein [Verrucomicrobiales bacterium]
MKPSRASALALVLFLLRQTAPAEGNDPNWPSFRGAKASGSTAGPAAPAEWDVASGRNIRWTASVPGLGLSSPVIWGDRLFITTAVRVTADGKDAPPAELKTGLYGDIESADDNAPHRFAVMCYDVKTGKELWNIAAHTGSPAIPRHPKASHANSTPAADATHVVSCFGTEGLYCHDHEGKLLWKKDLGRLDSGYYKVPAAQWGYGSSPVIAGDRVIVQADVQKGSFLAAFSLTDGREIWRTPRADVPTWSTPLVHEVAGKRQVIVNGWKHMGAYDFDTGAEIWRVSGGGDIPVPTPIAAHGLIFLTNAHGRLAPILAIKEDAKGNLSDVPDGDEPKNTAWSLDKWGNYMQTPILAGDLLFCCTDSGIATCFDARTGKNHFRERLGTGGFTASPVQSGDHLYFTGEEGSVKVIKAAKEFKPVATNELGAQCMATPAIHDGTIIFRTRKGLVAVGEKAK